MSQKQNINKSQTFDKNLKLRWSLEDLIQSYHLKQARSQEFFET